MKGTTIEWDDRYSVGIRHIDEQHKELIKMTNNLCVHCQQDGEGADESFRLAVYQAMESVKSHSSTEEQFLEKMQYPDVLNHKKQHEKFIQEINDKLQRFESGGQTVPGDFVQYLRDWVLTHIVFIDKKYATYLHILNDRGNAGTLLPNFRPGFQFLRQYIKPEPSLPSEMFWG